MSVHKCVLATLVPLLCLLAACGAQSTRLSRGTSAPAATALVRTSATPTAAVTGPARSSNPLRVFTLADDERTMTLIVGEGFGLELGPSGGSTWAVDVSDPSALEPSIRQISAAGGLILFVPVKIGSIQIDANSHIPCTGHGFCPEATTDFRLTLKVLPAED